MKTIISLLAVLSFAAFSFAAERPAPAATTPDAAGPDFAIQGEYAGLVERGLRTGLQVIALGQGRFRAVRFANGLPGEAGSQRSDAEHAANMQGDSVVFPYGDDTLTVGNGKAIIKIKSGETYELKRIVRESPTMGAKPPQGATILFDGTSLDAFRPGAKMDDRKLLAAGAVTKKTFSDFTLHAEFILPFMPASTGQARANSGIYIQNRYEMQILDSFGLKPNSGDCGAIYRQVAPKLNMCLPPLQWQTYDIDFTAPKWQDGKKTANAVVTVKLNGVTIHDNQEIKTKTGAGQPEGPTPGPIQFQNHGNPVFFRNLWIVEKK